MIWMPARNIFGRNLWNYSLSRTSNVIIPKLAGFSKGDADVLRRLWGKKQKDVLDKMKSKFIDQAKANGHDEQKN